MNKDKKLYIAGHNGLVGSALLREAKKRGYKNILSKSRSDLDLTERSEVFAFFEKNRPEYVFIAAAKVGGIVGNNNYPVEFLLENLRIQNNLIEACFKFSVNKMMFFGTSCIYPKHASQPLQEDDLLSGKLEPTNEPYALAKISGLKLCAAFNKQYHTNFLSVMPCNLYGINDNYHPENAHVLPMLLRRFHECKLSHAESLKVWGTGRPKREFLFVDDLADSCFYLMENYNASDLGEFVNIGTGDEITIRDLAQMIKRVVGYEGKIEFDTSRPDGTPRKVVDISRIARLGWRPKTSLEEGLKRVYEDFLEQSHIRV